MLAQSDCSILLLMRNALFPWFVIVPMTAETEFHRLAHEQQLRLLRQINLVSDFVEQTFAVQKLNVAWIGNIVSQLHIHIVGRSAEDCCWPGVVWGVKQFEAYSDARVEDIKSAAQHSLADEFLLY